MALNKTLISGALRSLLGARLVVTGGTDALRQVGSAFLQLKLVLDKGGKPETVYMGMRAIRRGFR